jgi:hypothetical protein
MSDLYWLSKSWGVAQRGHVLLAPKASITGRMLVGVPLPFTKEIDPRTFHQQVERNYGI